MSILKQIIEHKKEELATVMRSVPLAELKAKIADMKRTRPFMKAIKRDKDGPIRLIARDVPFRINRAKDHIRHDDFPCQR